MLESRAERSALCAAPDMAAVDAGLTFLCPTTLLLNHPSKPANDPSTITASTFAHETRFAHTRFKYIFATRPKPVEAQNRVRLGFSLKKC